ELSRSIPCRRRGIGVGTSLRQVGHPNPEDGVPTMTANTTCTGTLYIALELGCDKWLLACTTQAAQKPRFRPIPARDLDRHRQEIAKAKTRSGLPDEAPVRTCYEAGRDGFWLHRALAGMGIDNVVVDASAIEVNRRGKHHKTDPADAAKLVSLLC